MRAIETTTVVTPERTITIPVPTDIPAGTYQIVIVLDVPAAPQQTNQSPAPRQMTVLSFNWEGPYSFEEVKNKNGPADYGLYQICAWHRVFGPGSLVYVGIADRQTFGLRLSQQWSWAKDEREVTFYIGRLTAPVVGDEQRTRLLQAAEKLAIHSHSPPYNSKEITCEPKGMFIHVQNWGDRGWLDMEYSSDWPDPDSPGGGR